VSENIASIRIVDISTLDEKDWQVVSDIEKSGVSYCARHDYAKLTFKDGKKIINQWTFANNSIITFRDKIDRFR
jgi:hypothetical protein